MLLTELIDNATVTAAARGCDPEIRGLTADSRTVEPGYLFAALAGRRSNGADFVADAVARGAVAILGADDLAPGPGIDAAVIRDANPRRRLAEVAARFHPRQPPDIVAVTGTNGKTSVVHFTGRIWHALGHRSGTIGTLGARWRGHAETLPTTTPEPVALHRLLDRLAAEDVAHVAIEASSHGLDQHRLDAVRIDHAGFTNLSHDHLDYHGSREAYLAAKARLFAELLRPGGTAVLNADDEAFDHLAGICRARGRAVLGYGAAAADIRVAGRRPAGDGQHVDLELRGRRYRVRLPLVGDFQLANALCALGLAIASGAPEAEAVAALERLTVVPGRLEKVAARRTGAGVYVDYAHTPGALERALGALRQVVPGRIVAVIGAGGERDRDKRPLMGAVAARLADLVIVTDDNPRGEDPAAIRRAVLSCCGEATEIGDRAAAIRAGLRLLGAGDALLIAGKGHESGQRIGARTLPFDDREVARRALAEIERGEP